MVAFPIKPLIYITTFGVATGAGFQLKYFLGGYQYQGKEDLKDKVVIITGANTGIGKDTAREFAARNAKVILACRDKDKCNKTRKQIILDTKNKNVYCRECDLASQQSIREFVTRFKNASSKLHILVNNAGVMQCPRSYTKDGIEMQLGVNHMGHFLLTNLLLDTLKNSAPSRIVNVSSAAHLQGKLKVEDLNSMDKYDASEAYAQSKLANVLFTRELAKRLEGTKVTVNAVHPGIVDTEITRHMKFINNSVIRFLTKPFVWPFVKSPVQGARAVLHAALDPSLDNVTGCYFSDEKISEISDEAKNDTLARWLWLVSEKWTKLNSI